MYYWTHKSREMMQKVIDDFKEILKKRNLNTFLHAAIERQCPFCKEAGNDENGFALCDNCRIYKKFGELCYTVFPVWNRYHSVWMCSKALTLPKLQSLLRAGIKELEPWGLEKR